MKPSSASIIAMCLGIWCAAPAAAQTPTSDDIDPQAVEALKRMSAFLGTLSAFELKADGAFDLVLDDGQKLQFGEQSVFKVRTPNGFVIERTGDYKQRRFTYDGKQLTVYSPRLGFYAQTAAPPTIRETLSAVSDRYGIELPLTDLFRWSQPDGGRVDQLREAFYVGPATVDGALTDHYAFREPDVDWQIWIARGDAPVPRKVVIVDRTDDAAPQYAATLSWNLKPSFTPATFTFEPPKGATPIKLTALKQ